MTAKEFYETIKQYAKKEMIEQSEKYTAAVDDRMKQQAHLGASNEAEKFYRMIEALWIDNAHVEI